LNEHDPNSAPLLLPGRSRAAVALERAVRAAATCRLPVLIQGESGSGKEGVARAIHAWSPRGSGPWVAVNCAALGETLLEAELFGATRGAYTGCDRDRPGLLRQAHGGTLLLDEVGEMSPSLQGKLLRFLDGGCVRPVGGSSETRCDVRIVAATHRDLRLATGRGQFRTDLWWRLAVVRIRVPPLRERTGDLAVIVAALRPRLETECARSPLRLTGSALEKLARHRWPGNLRELRGVLARALLASEREPLDADAFALEVPPAGDADSGGLEARMIRGALETTTGNIGRAAASIGWTRQKLYRRMVALGIRTRQSITREADPTTSSASSTFQ
jgi:DNA-binding NtrC family response regulator